MQIRISKHGEKPRMLWVSLIALMVLIAASPGIMLYFEHRQAAAGNFEQAGDAHSYQRDAS
ncbi:hypothetical protein [Chloroflexus sp.]|uniref:hypothetical protein n=1 Tax=Chloroflexus sp. TaxID=1904827 RepID=UPI0029FA03E0|nr:hypothetical protein [Chloroflexus sp.]MCS6889802.1 hypothetical protein [Chloroflexus sp.]